MPRGFFVTFEGLDGSGKTTQLRSLAASLTADGLEIISLRQPGSTALGDRIRALLLDSRSENVIGAVAPLAELALMFADRAQSITEVIKPALDAGSIVLCDRFTDSSEAYQGGGRQLGSSRVLALHTALCENLQPDLTLMLLPPLSVSLARARRRNQRKAQGAAAANEVDENRFEHESDAFYHRVDACYRHIAAREPRRVVVFAEDHPIEQIQKNIHHVVTSRLEGHRSAGTKPLSAAMLEA